MGWTSSVRSYLGVGGIDHFGYISVLHSEEGDHAPASKKSHKEQNAEDVCAGPLLDYWVVIIILVGLPVGFVLMPLNYKKKY